MSKNKIPKSFKLFATTIKVVFENKKMSYSNQVGESCFTQSKITLCDVFKGDKMDKDCVIDSFYHEKVHMILDSMERGDLSQDEQFVEVFSRLLRQSNETAKY